MGSDIALLWDVENIDSRGDKIEIVELIQTLEEWGRIVLRKAYADWYRLPRQAANNFHNNHFELLLVPHEDGIKNSVDIKIAVDIVNIINDYPSIEYLVLIANDGDYRHVSSTARLRGRKFILVCNPERTNTNLLDMVDEYIDVDNYMPDIEPQSPDTESGKKIRDTTVENTNEVGYLFEILMEAINHVADEYETNTVRYNYVLTRLKAIEPRFSDLVTENTDLNFTSSQKKRWYVSFLREAEEKELISLTFVNNFYEIEILDETRREMLKKKDTLRRLAREILHVGHAHGTMSLNDFSSKIHTKIVAENIPYFYKDVGYKKIRNLVEDIGIPLIFEKEQNGQWIIVMDRDYYKSIEETTTGTDKIEQEVHNILEFYSGKTYISKDLIMDELDNLGFDYDLDTVERIFEELADSYRVTPKRVYL